MARLPGPGLTAETTEATLAVQAGVFFSGSVRQEVWGPDNTAITRAQVEAGSAGEPTSAGYISQFATTDFANNYVQRLRCLFTPSVSGNYVFFVCSDDDSDLFVSTDFDPANKRLVAQETSWSVARQWTTSDGGSVLIESRILG